MELLDHALIGGFTVLHALVVAGAMFVAAFVLALSSGPRQAPLAEHRADRLCPACGWLGSVSKRVPRCPKCGATLPV